MVAVTPSVTVVIPTLNEADVIAGVVREVPCTVASEIIVADSGSKDGTQQIAAEAGARVLDLQQRGYGLACARAAEQADPASDIIVFMDGDGADRADMMHLLVDPIRAGTHDFVIASRTRGERDPGSMNWHQVLAGRAAGLGMRALYGVRYTDMCAFRAIRRSSLLALGLREMTYGWNIEMQMQAARAGLRILEVPRALSLPGGWQEQGRRVAAGHAARGLAHRHHVRPGRRLPSRPAPSRHRRERMLSLAAAASGCAGGAGRQPGCRPAAVMGIWWTQDQDGVVELYPCAGGAVRPGGRDRGVRAGWQHRPAICTGCPAATCR